MIPTRENALELLKKYNRTDSLIKHALAVEAVMRYMARKWNEDEEKWGIIGLIHDLDYEMYPDQHCSMTKKILEENDWPEEYIRAVLSHGWGLVTDIEPLTLMEKTLYAMDELTGLVVTSALVRPSKSVLDMEAKSVKKKWNDKRCWRQQNSNRTRSRIARAYTGRTHHRLYNGNEGSCGTDRTERAAAAVT